MSKRFGFTQLTRMTALTIVWAALNPGNVLAQAGSGASPSLQKPHAPAPEADSDSADIPPFARDRISQEEYFALRDQEINRRRGMDDLVRTPQARSLAISRAEVLQKASGLVLQGLNPLSALLPAAATVAWTPLGPAPIPNGQTTAISVPVSGRVTAIAVDPATDQTVYVGTAQGGVYRSLDGGATWAPLMDTAQSLAIGALAVDPVNPNILFVGTGEGNLSGDSFFGVGLYIIQGASTGSPVLTGPFNSDGANDVFTGRAITRIIVHPTDDTKVLVSTASGASGLSADSFGALPTRGVYLSSNAQSATPTFTRLTVQAAANANRTVTDMVIDPGNPGKLLVWIIGNAVAGDGGLWMTTAGDPWANTATFTQNANFTRQGFAKFAVNRSGNPATTTFMLAQDESVACGAVNVAGTVYTSTTGSTWTQLPAANGFCGGQCFYDMVPAFDPTNAATIFLGGSSNSGGACPTNVFVRSTNGGAAFNRIDAQLHADSHVLVFAPSNPNVVYVGNDGGIFRSDDGGASWVSRNTAGFNATQFVSFSVHPADPNFSIGGTQDNGTEFMRPDGTWTRADAGDGGYSAIDQGSVDTTSVTMYHTYFNQTDSLIALARVTTSANAHDGGWAVLGCSATGGLVANGFNCADAVLFYPPLALGPGTPNALYFGTDHLYRSPDRGSTMGLVSQAFACCNPNNQNRNFRVSAIGVSPQDDNIRLVGLENGKVFATTTGANPIADVTGPWPAKFIARAVVDPNNKSTAYVTLDGYGTQAAPVAHVWKTTNLSGEPPTPTWTSVSNGLPDVPVNAFAIDAQNSSFLYAGTDIGVFNSTDGGATWAPFGTGLPRVAVFDLKIQGSSHKVRIGTHGRGAWEIAAADVGVILPPDYFINVPNGTSTVIAGQPASYAINVTTQGGFSGTVTFSCAGNPSASSCSFNPPSVAPNGGQAGSTLTISTTARPVAAVRPRNGISLAAMAMLGLMGVVFISAGPARKQQAKLLLLLIAAMTVTISSCGGGGSAPPVTPPPGTPAGTFSVTISATAGATTKTSVITLVVQ